MTTSEQAPPFDISRPTAARMYDYYLGGKDNFAVDRVAVAELDKVAPGTRALALNNRAFLGRAVRYLAEECGMRQYLDWGSGLPTQENVHQIAQRVDPSCRVVYVDNDPIVLAHGRALLVKNAQTTVITADMRRPDEVLENPEVRQLLNFDEPVAVLYNSVMHCVGDEDQPTELIRRMMAATAPGSMLVACQLVSGDAKVRDWVSQFMAEQTGGNWGRVRTPEFVHEWFEGLEVVEPGLVEVSKWRPDPSVPRQETFEMYEYGGIARKL